LKRQDEGLSLLAYNNKAKRPCLTESTKSLVNKRNNEANNLYARLLCLWSKEDPVDINMKLENICQQLDTKPQVS